MSDVNTPASLPDSSGDHTTDSIVVEVLREYIRPGMVESAVRTVVPYVVGLVLSYIAVHWHIVVPEKHTSTVVLLTAGTVTTVYYIVARIIERKFPRIGRILLALGMVKAQPVYAEHDTVKAVAGGDTTPVPAGTVKP